MAPRYHAAEGYQYDAEDRLRIAQDRLVYRGNVGMNRLPADATGIGRLPEIDKEHPVHAHAGQYRARQQFPEPGQRGVKIGQVLVKGPS